MLSCKHRQGVGLKHSYQVKPVGKIPLVRLVGLNTHKLNGHVLKHIISSSFKFSLYRNANRFLTNTQITDMQIRSLGNLSAAIFFQDG